MYFYRSFPGQPDISNRYNLKLKRNILLKRTVIISLVTFSILITAGIILIFRSSLKRDANHVDFVRIAGNAENEILKTRLYIDEILLQSVSPSFSDLKNQVESVRFVLGELHRMVSLHYDNFRVSGYYDFEMQYDLLIRRLASFEEIISSGVPSESEMLKGFNEFNLIYKDYEANLPRLVLIDNTRYKTEIFVIVTLNLLFLLLAGYVIIRLINQLIIADRSLIRKTIEVETRERERIAADLHDGLGSLLSGLLIHIQVMEKKYGDKPELKEQLKNLNELSNSAISGIEEVISNLNPARLARYGLIESLRKIVDNINRLGKTQFLINAENLQIEFQKSTELLLYRICNELINNALKHSDAGIAEFVFYNIKKEFHLIYTDDGVGFSSDIKVLEEEKGGLYNLIRRVESMEGTYRIESEPEKGVKIEIIFSTGS